MTAFDPLRKFGLEFSMTGVDPFLPFETAALEQRFSALDSNRLWQLRRTIAESFLRCLWAYPVELYTPFYTVDVED
jgi:hypothetical protein